VDLTKAKYKINYNPVNYNNNTGMYESGSETFSRYEEAKANQWKCEKCNDLRFGTFKKLKEHKVQNHSY
jgi:hypothetical protein